MWLSKQICFSNIHIFELTQHCFPLNVSLWLQWETVQYFDNKIICDLIEEKHKGIISILVRIITASLCVYLCIWLYLLYISVTVAKQLCCPSGWGVSETWRGLWCLLFREVGGHAGWPSPFCHVSIILYQMLLWDTVLFWIQLLISADLCIYISQCVSMYFSHKLANGKTRRVMSREEFRLLHYAGEVNYNVNGKM